MPIAKTFNDMVRDGISYLSQNTDITYFSKGSIARALVEATSLEINRLQQFVLSTVDNSFISTASGIYLDLFGEMLGLPRIKEKKASFSAEDSILRFYVDSGTLGSRLSVSPTSLSTIPAGTVVQNAAGTVQFTVPFDVNFPSSQKFVYVPAISETSGASSNIGANQLTVHSLSNQEVRVTNDTTIVSGSDLEPDNEYRFRLSKAMTAKFGSNSTAVQLAAISQAGVSKVELLEFARGAGTFDVLVIPQGNRVSRSTLENVRRSVEQVVAYGISPKIKEPEYVPVKFTIQLSYNDQTLQGQKINAKRAAESAALRYLSSIPLGGELIINQLRASIINSDSSIKDLQIIELCVDSQQRIIRNIKLRKDELFIPDESAEDPIKII